MSAYDIFGLLLAIGGTVFFFSVALRRPGAPKGSRGESREDASSGFAPVPDAAPAPALGIAHASHQGPAPSDCGPGHHATSGFDAGCSVDVASPDSGSHHGH
jgi:hypothetical protein